MGDWAPTVRHCENSRSDRDDLAIPVIPVRHTLNRMRGGMMLSETLEKEEPR